jgi:hypothetical protein
MAGVSVGDDMVLSAVMGDACSGDGLMGCVGDVRITLAGVGSVCERDVPPGIAAPF